MVVRTLVLVLLVLGVFATTLGGCTLALDTPGTLTPQCRFNGDEDSTCGRCISQNCQAPLGACCGDATCKDTLDALDDCAGKDDQEACARVREDGTIGACVSASCKDDCRGEGEGTCYDAGTSCFCDAIAPSDTMTCSESTVGGGICCADLGWPGSGLECTCQAFRCKETSDGCTCSTYSDGPMTSCEGVHCCLSSTECSCSSKACDPDLEESIPSCTSDLLTCSGKGRVSSCSESVE